MTSKHTPGPWSLSDETVRDGLLSKLVHGMPEGMLAIVRVEHQGKYYGDANARLIAAAPDLLDAVRALNIGPEAIVAGTADHLIVKLPIKAITAAAVAIAKAEGRS